MVWDNPIWTYRIRARWWRRLPSRVKCGITLAAIAVGALTSLVAARWAFSTTRALQMYWPPGGRGLFPHPTQSVRWLYMLYSGIAALCAGLTASTAVVSERQRGTWDALVVSGLSPGEILLAKFARAVWPLLLVGVWLAPIWAASFVGAHRGPRPPGPIADWTGGCWAGLRAAARPVPFAALGLYVSFRSRALPTAAAVTMACAVVLLAVSEILVPRMPYDPYALEMIPIWFLARWPLAPPLAAVGRYPFRMFDRFDTSLSLLADVTWVAVIPTLLLARLTQRFEEFDRTARGDRGGLGSARPETLEGGNTPTGPQP